MDSVVVVTHDARRLCTKITGVQIIKDSTIENAMTIPALEAIFANANPEDYFNQVLAVAVHQAYVLDKIESALKLK